MIDRQFPRDGGRDGSRALRMCLHHLRGTFVERGQRAFNGRKDRGSGNGLATENAATLIGLGFCLLLGRDESSFARESWEAAAGALERGVEVKIGEDDSREGEGPLLGVRPRR